MDLSHILFLDLETTGLGERDEIWQAAWILGGVERSYLIEHTVPPSPWVMANTRYADTFMRSCTSVALAVEVFVQLAADIAVASADGGRITLAGNTPGFDDDHLRRVFAERPYHYQLLDVEVYAIGALGRTSLDFSPTDLRAALGMPPRPEGHVAHDALDDARECRDIFVAAATFAHAHRPE